MPLSTRSNWPLAMNHSAVSQPVVEVQAQHMPCHAVDYPVLIGQPAADAMISQSASNQRLRLGEEVQDMLDNIGRLQWTPELEELFLAAVEELGGFSSKC